MAIANYVKQMVFFVGFLILMPLSQSFAADGAMAIDSQQRIPSERRVRPTHHFG